MNPRLGEAIERRGEERRGSGEREKKMVQVLVSARSRELKKEKDEKGEKVVYWRMEFHRVDLKGEEDENIEIERDWLPSFWCRCATGSMFNLGPFVYLIGSLLERNDDELIPSGPPPLIPYPYDRGGLMINIRRGGVWRTAPIPINYSFTPVCALCDWGEGEGDCQIYSFGTVLTSVEVFDPAVAAWKVLPPPPSDIIGSDVSKPAVADPSRRRFLVHLSSRDRGLYAFYPEDCRWESLSLYVDCWGQVVAGVVDDFLFLYLFEFPNLLKVFDLATRTWLAVVWDQRPNNRIHFDFARFPFDALFPLGPNTLCLAGFTNDYSNTANVYIDFLKFTFSRCPTRPATLILTPLAFSSLQLPNTCHALNFLPI